MIKAALAKFGFMEADNRSQSRIKYHYQTEKMLAQKLRQATSNERTKLYAEVYDELFSKVLDHPQLIDKVNVSVKSRNVLSKLSIIRPSLNKDTIFMELGAGDCSLSLEVAKYVKKVIAVDVSKIVTSLDDQTDNFELIITDGRNINVEPESVDVVYSNQLMEHLHPDDAKEQLNNVYKALKTGGRYICITPHSFSGPHDVSKYFDDIATGFHLKEYSYAELTALFKQVGFSRFLAVVGKGKIYLKLPLNLLLFIETLLGWLPKRLRKAFSKTALMHLILGIKIIATK